MPDKNPDFVHLHVHSCYTLRRSTVCPHCYCARAADLGMTALAITDRMNLFAVPEFINAAQRAGIKPLLGMELRIALDSRGSVEGEADCAALVALAENRIGWLNLCRISNQGFKNNAAFPFIDLPFFFQHCRGLIVLTGGRDGLIPSLLDEEDNQQARAALENLRDIIGKNNLYVEMTPSMDNFHSVLVDLAWEAGVPLVAAGDTYFLTTGDYFTIKMAELHNYQSGCPQGDALSLRLENYFQKPHEMDSFFRGIPEAVSNSALIAARCSVNPGEPVSIQHDGPGTGLSINTIQSPGQQLRQLCEAALKEKPGLDQQAAAARLEQELAAIAARKQAGLLLLLHEAVTICRENDWLPGPGSGATGSSLVSYLLGITGFDPMQHGLYFERLAAPASHDPIRFFLGVAPQHRRPLTEQLQANHPDLLFAFLSQPCFLRSEGANALVRNVLGLDQSVDCRHEPLLSEEDWERFKQGTLPHPQQWIYALGNLITSMKPHQDIFHYDELIVCNRKTGTALPRFRPAGSDAPVLQFPHAFGLRQLSPPELQSFFIRALPQLAVLERGAQLIKEQGERVDWTSLPLDDLAVWELFRLGCSERLFLADPRDMAAANAVVKADCFSDLAALYALGRPGPLENGLHIRYGELKQGTPGPEYPIPAVAELLDETHGLLLYQEQLIALAVEIAGLDAATGNQIRKALGQKKKAEIAAYRVSFIDGAQQQGHNPQAAAALYDTLNTATEHVYQKAHALGEAFLSYRLAWFKAHYPLLFELAWKEVDTENS